MNVLWSQRMLTAEDDRTLSVFLRGLYLTEPRASCGPLTSMAFKRFQQQCRSAQQGGQHVEFSTWLPEGLKVSYTDGHVHVLRAGGLLPHCASLKRDSPGD
jgi:hypothetical protein